jgi:hypothetical protein
LYAFVHGRLLHRVAGARDEINVVSWRTFSDVRVEICKDQTSRCALYMYGRLLPCLYLVYYDLEAPRGPRYRVYPKLFPRADLSTGLGVIALDAEAWQCFSSSTRLEEEKPPAPRIRYALLVASPASRSTQHDALAGDVDSGVCRQRSLELLY